MQARVYLAGRDPRGLTDYATAVSTLDAVVPARTQSLNASSVLALVSFGQPGDGRASGYDAVTGLGTPHAGYFGSWRPSHAR